MNDAINALISSGAGTWVGVVVVISSSSLSTRVVAAAATSAAERLYDCDARDADARRCCCDCGCCSEMVESLAPLPFVVVDAAVNSGCKMIC